MKSRLLILVFGFLLLLFFTLLGLVMGIDANLLQSEAELRNDLREAVAEARRAQPIIRDEVGKATLKAAVDEVERVISSNAGETMSQDKRQELVGALDGLLRALASTTSGNPVAGAEGYAAARVAQAQTQGARERLVETRGPALLRGLGWIGETTRLFMPWPIIVIVLLVVLAVSLPDSSMQVVFQRLTALDLFGIKLSLGEATAAIETSKRIENAIKKARSELKDEYVQRASTANIRSKVETLLGVVTTQLEWKDGKYPTGFRCTLHVPDALFEESLTQLIDYYPNGGGAGRAWSERYGIIGLAWRTGRPQQNSITEVNELIDKAGMTAEEAHSKSNRSAQGFSCTVLHLKEDKVAVFYMDADEGTAFVKANDEFHKAVDKKAEEIDLTKLIGEISTKIRARSPRIKFFGESV